MTTSNIKVIIQCDIHKVWETVLAVERYHTWRSDVSRTELIDGKQFIEYSPNGYPTTFTVTVVEPFRRWSLMWKTAIQKVTGLLYLRPKPVRPMAMKQKSTLQRV